jgi:hypothetical protein
MTNGGQPAINGYTATGGRLAISIRTRLIQQDKRFKETSSIVGQFTEEVTDAAVAPTPHITAASKVVSEFQCHLPNPEDKGMMEKVLFQ